MPILNIIAVVACLAGAGYFAYQAWDMYRNFERIWKRIIELKARSDAKTLSIEDALEAFREMLSETVWSMRMCAVALALVAMMYVFQAFNVALISALAS